MYVTIDNWNSYLTYACAGLVVAVTGSEWTEVSILQHIVNYLLYSKGSNVITVVDGSVCFLNVDIIYIIQALILFLTVVLTAFKGYMDLMTVVCTKKNCNKRE